MTRRILHDGEPGALGVGLVAIEQSTAKPIPHDSHVLVTVRNHGIPFSYLVTPTDIFPGVNSEDFVKSVARASAPSRVRQAISIVGYSLISVLLLTLLAVGLTGSLSLRVVLTESMKPTINPGDVIVSLSDNLVTPKMGDVVVYTAKRFDGTPVAPFAHRIVGGDAASGWIVKGDNNPNADVQHPDSEDITAVVVSVWPGVGNFMNVQVLVLIAMLFVAVWLIVSGIRGRPVTDS